LSNSNRLDHVAPGPPRGPGAAGADAETAWFSWDINQYEYRTDAQGGEASPFNKGHLTRGKERTDTLEPHRLLKLHGGQLSALTGGGAGVGEASKRDPQAVSAAARLRKAG
jgi:hypothetical protein